MFLTIIIGIVIFMSGMIFLNFIDFEVDNMMGDLGCGYVTSNGTINSPDTVLNNTAGLSDGVKATCLIGEIVVPYFIIVVIGAAGGIIIARFIT